MIRAGVLRMMLSILIAVMLAGGMARPCAACGTAPAAHATMDMMSAVHGMDRCNDMPVTAPAPHMKQQACPHCLAFGGGVLVPAPGQFHAASPSKGVSFTRAAALPAGVLRSPDTGPPRNVRI